MVTLFALAAPWNEKSSSSLHRHRYIVIITLSSLHRHHYIVINILSFMLIYTTLINYPAFCFFLHPANYSNYMSAFYSNPVFSLFTCTQLKRKHRYRWVLTNWGVWWFQLCFHLAWATRIPVKQIAVFFHGRGPPAYT